MGGVEEGGGRGSQCLVVSVIVWRKTHVLAS